VSRRIAVVTGATSGIGEAAALALARGGHEVIALGRSESAGRRLEAHSRRFEAPIRFCRVDLASLADVRRAAAALPLDARLDALVNNAGARFDSYSATVDGFERTFAVNHLSHFLLTALLLDRLLASDDGRIVNLGSGAHAASLDRGWMLSSDSYDRKVAYATSKLANVVFTYELARRLATTTVSVNAIDPGGVATNLGRNNGLIAWARHLAYYAARRELKSATRAGNLVARAASDANFRHSTGQYLAESGAIRSSPISYERARADELWNASVTWTGVDAGIGAAWKYLAPRGLAD
jgi:NAD(P)-dependent dehydrogenase (short-subunit alcohol dehydrogenase family)